MIIPSYCGAAFSLNPVTSSGTMLCRATAGLLMEQFDHHTSRDPDPQLHTTLSSSTSRRAATAAARLSAASSV
jgi:hypothetical protein